MPMGPSVRSAINTPLRSAAAFRRELEREALPLGPAMGRKNTAAFLKRHMAAGNLRTADPLQAADDFLDMLVSSRYLTAVVLGQMRSFLKPLLHVEHAVDLFLTYYGANKSARKVRNRAPGTGNDESPPEP
jgi:hypothetical protein